MSKCATCGFEHEAEARKAIKVQGENGNWNYDSYMHGMYNGMELMLAIFENREPEYRKAPDKWLKDIENIENSVQLSTKEPKADKDNI